MNQLQKTKRNLAISVSMKNSQKSKEHLQRLHALPSKEVVAINDVGSKLMFASAKVASEALGICRASITKCCNGKAKTAGGYKWEYLEK